MVQKTLDPSQIQSMDHSAIPRIRLPERATVFLDRAARLRKLADNNPISGYIRLMATLVDAQHHLLASTVVTPPSKEAIAQAQQHSMPLLPALSSERDPVWRDVLHRLLDKIEAAGAITPALGKVLDALRLNTPAQLDAQADAVLTQRYSEIDPATAPFIMASLQVVWTDLASRLDPRDIPYLDTPGVCPVCGALPVASIVRVGGQYQGYRFLQCGLCANEWHMVRTKCSNCDSTKGIAYHGIEGGSAALKAESCDECHTYRKIGYQEKNFEFEPLADDLASLTLDLLMNEAGYRRSGPNPLLWPEAPADA
ncbi:formate dehydrogenase accessory protein FdhE [Paraburkholderia sp. DHOC27]|uniref:formate dehydrogenase accessory protein FdhE n=1 Tax=Paraburkholderia sp. DHOC27 TaxID=2303330 RepID=UPI000E3C46F7|nr:formate dehydrogenase accessory protein FdhE [Paraburkholderia sp. DHOC27]RFU49025.1 formate dehydrogenase accessory protein FdhE [Paraburkholderia sp. DHOC27]